MAVQQAVQERAAGELVGHIQPATLTPKEAAIYLGVSEGTLEVWRCTRRYPDLRYVKVGNRVKYRKADLDAWLAARTIGTPIAASSA